MKGWLKGPVDRSAIPSYCTPPSAFLIHDFAIFHGWELVFELAIHVFGRFYGREIKITGCLAWRSV